MIYTIKPTFNIGDRVFVNLPNADDLLVTDIVYSARFNTIEYECMNSFGTRENYTENEITTEKQVI